MAKRNVAFIKPEEPAFLKRLKAEAGYVEKDTVDTKKEALPAITAEDEEDKDEEQPVVVVVKPGDLSAEEVAEVKAQIEKEKEDAPADLSERIVFKAPVKAANEDAAETPQQVSRRAHKDRKGIKNVKMLSFDEEEHDDG
ncbi:uncharacterized protein KIAA1143 homolog [Bacillus rossius redtenbacheri]|uniref:uncharacterized protein KIAA1143 homolog n=1 Tax=Bacillus rossius redtenbacheri TaxID=93214 RepID=UPI002FDE9945